MWSKQDVSNCRGFWYGYQVSQQATTRIAFVGWRRPEALKAAFAPQEANELSLVLLKMVVVSALPPICASVGIFTSRR